MSERHYSMLETFNIVCSSCKKLALPSMVASLAMTYLHRHENIKGKSDCNTYYKDCTLLCAASILLGCKTTENLRTMRDIFNVVYSSTQINASAQELDMKYLESKLKMIELEHILLRTIQFEVEFELPYKYLYNIARFVKAGKGEVILANTFLFDAFISPKCLSYKPEIIAAACLQLACEMQPQLTGQTDVSTIDRSIWKLLQLPEARIIDAVQWLSQIVLEHSPHRVND